MGINDIHRFPQEIIDAISQCRSSGFTFPAEDIKRLMHVADRFEDPFCKGIDGPSHFAISSVVMYSEPCGARHRGFFVLAVGLPTRGHPA